MSTLAYGAMTGKRNEADPGTSTSDSPPGLRSYVDALAALVPAEVLTVHAVVLSFTTQTTNEVGGAVTKITAPGTLKGVFIALILVSIGLYVVGRLSHSQQKWERWDFARMFIPALAFVGWTMLQKATAFDAVAPGLPEAPRDAIAVIGAVVLGVVTVLLAYRVDLKNPT